MDVEKRGYLNQDFRFFHLRGQNEQQYGYHYHEFNKIILLLSGRVDYLIEGKTWFLKPWDILLVNHHDIHRPSIDNSEPYERIVIWISPAYIGRVSQSGDDLAACFLVTKEENRNLIRLDAARKEYVRELLSRLEATIQTQEYGANQLAEALIVQFLVWLNRMQLGKKGRQGEDTLKYDPRIESLLKYINEHLKEELSIDELASRIFVSRFYLMHRFKEETGYTIYNYMIQKRLLLAKEKMDLGIGVSQAASECGFREYSAFLRAFKKTFGMTPTQYQAEGRKLW